jgi:hypothetical protein
MSGYLQRRGSWWPTLQCCIKLADYAAPAAVGSREGYGLLYGMTTLVGKFIEAKLAGGGCTGGILAPQGMVPCRNGGQGTAMLPDNGTPDGGMSLIVHTKAPPRGASPNQHRPI